MAPSIIYNNASPGDVFLPGQIFVFGGFALRANSLGHLEKIDSYAPGHQVGFGNLNYTADIREDLIFDGLEPMSGAPNGHPSHDLDLPSGSIQNIAPATTPDFGPGQVVPPEDGWMDSAPEAAHPSALGPNAKSSPREICISGPPDLCPGVGSEPRASEPIESDWAPIMEFTVADLSTPPSAMC